MGSGSCSACGTENPAGAKFCMSCGAALASSCPNCGTENPPQAKFCIECGTNLAAPAPAEPAAAAPTVESAPPEERRQATVLFADLSGYTAVAERMDPETTKSLVDRALRRLGQEVERYGGTVDKYIGDNVMAVFGAPISHEDDPERAVRAGLAMQGAMAEINAGLAANPNYGDASFLLRVGVNSGEVLAGRVGDEYTVIGDAVNVAARLQAAARPGTVTVGESTHRVTLGSIDYTELEPLELKGKSEPVPAWEASGVSVAGGLRAARSGSPLIGRDDESALLLSLYERVVREGRSHLVTVIGQAGVGKSRLITELTDRLSARPELPTVRVGRCPAYGTGITYWALGEILRAQFEIHDTDEPEVAFGKLRSGLEQLLSESSSDESPERLAVLIARSLGIEPPADSEPVSGVENENPQQMRDRIFSAIRVLAEAISEQSPFVLIVEDIHWADEGMLDLIDHLARWVRGPLLLVCLARDELLDRRPGWGGGRRNATSLSLEPLTADQARELVGALVPAGGNGDQLDIGPLIGQVAERSGGNPLFAEEMVNLMEENRTMTMTGVLPETVHSVLAARLDSLGRGERRVVQHASVVGQTFWLGSLIGAAEEEGLDLDETIRTLEEKDLVVRSAGTRLAGQQEYSFKHVLIRDVAYSTLPKSVRARKHFEVGRFVADSSGEHSEGTIAIVAEHFARAATLAAESDLDPAERELIVPLAISSLESAGDAAAALYSNQEALGHYSTALDLPGGLPPVEEARIAEKRGDVALRLGRVDEAVEVWEQALEHHRREEDLARIGDLHRKIGAGLWHKGEREASIGHYQKGIDLLKDGPPCIELVRLYEEAASLYLHTGDNMLAIYAAEKALRLAERLGESAAASRAHLIFGRVFGRIGNPEKARENLERSVELARESDPGEAIRALLALGNHLEISEAAYDAAADAYGEALALSEQVGDLPSQVELHAALAHIAAYGARWDEAERATEASATLADREGLLGKLCFPELMRGVLRWRESNWDEAARILRRARDLGDAAGRSEVAFSALYWLARSLRDQGDYGAADTALTQALDICERAGLVAQSMEATAARALTLSLSGRPEQAAEAAEETRRLSERLQYPAGSAAALEASGATAEDPVAGAEQLAEARDVWAKLGRPVDATRCELHRGRLLVDADPAEAAAILERAAASAEELGIRHLAERARRIASG
jgi:class 3 adenylate cyclase/tetratricopeptide (TPR) repeat protein